MPKLCTCRSQPTLAHETRESVHSMRSTVVGSGQESQKGAGDMCVHDPLLVFLFFFFGGYPPNM